MRLSIQHTTAYQYNQAFGYAISQICLSPPSDLTQTVESWHIQAPGKLFSTRDAFGNQKHQYSFIGHSQTSMVHAAGIVNTHGLSMWQETSQQVMPQLYLRSGPLTATNETLTKFAKQAIAGKQPAAIDALLRLAQAVRQRVVYAKNQTSVDTSAEQAFAGGVGVCQDQAHVMLAACRSLLLPSRYVSGYFYAEHEPDLASHAWVEVCIDCDNRQWVGIDVTHGCLVDERHVRIATGIDYTSCPPLKGIRHGGENEAMDVTIRIQSL